MNDQSNKIHIQTITLIVSVVLLVIKFAAYYVTNSVGILTDAMESIVNVVAAIVSLYCIWFASRPKDKTHPFGHGKIELISASIEGAFISIAGLLIIWEGVKRLLVPVELQSLDIGIIIVAAAGAINYMVGWYSIRTGKKTNSVALEASGRHLQSDTYSSIGLIIGLILLRITGIWWLDSLLAFVFGALIIFTGIGILRKTVRDLLDTADQQLLSDIATTISEKRHNSWIDIHNVKILKYGSFFYLDSDLTLPWYFNVAQSHHECEQLERIIKEKYPDRFQASIHADPCTMQMCDKCAMRDCSYRTVAFSAFNKINLETITQSDDERHEHEWNNF